MLRRLAAFAVEGSQSRNPDGQRGGDSMNWNAIGAIAEALGALAVLASLIYLAAQIRQNTQMMKSAIRQQLTTSTQNVVFKMMDNAETLAKLQESETLTPGEQVRMRLLVRAGFRGFEDFAYQHHHGLLDASEWSARLVAMRTSMAMPGAREQWLATRNEYSENLQRILDPLASADPPEARDAFFPSVSGAAPRRSRS
jgi:hypothetical protein